MRAGRALQGGAPPPGERRRGRAVRLGPGAVEIDDGSVRHRLDLAGLAADADGLRRSRRGRLRSADDHPRRDGQGEPYASYAFGAQLAEVAVDMELGTVRVTRVTAAHDVGRAINPVAIEGQIEGGIVQGLGMALMEEYVPGRTDSLDEYMVPMIGDVPPRSRRS